ncbi:wings apart-like protein homolog [Diadema setosum]|uniref:wings apart-like protein homolog n=1 Tax=Diadema setosum TaxID=31175 RepID=UPI003B3B3768
MPRFGAKTYGRSVRSEGSDHFDDLWNKTRVNHRPVTRLSPAKRPANSQQTSRQLRSSPAKPSRMANSESSRPTRQNTFLREDVVGVTSPKRRRRTSGADDPFSFSSDDDKSPAKNSSNADTKNATGSSSSTRQSRTSLQFDNGVDSRNNSKGAMSTRSGAKDKTPAGQTLITQFSHRTRGSAPNERRDDSGVSVDSRDDGVGRSSNGSTSLGSTHSLGSVRPVRKQGGKLETVQEQDSQSLVSSGGMSSQSSSDSAYSQRGASKPVQGSSQTSARTLKTDTPVSGSSEDFIPVSDDSDDPEVTIMSSTKRQNKGLESSKSVRPSNSLSQSSTSKPHLKAVKSLPPAKPSPAAYDEFDFDEDDNEKEAPALRKVKSAGSVETVKKIFNSPKKSPAKAKYNARSWNKPDMLEEEEFSAAPTPANPANLPAKPAAFRNEGKKRPSGAGLTRSTTYPNKPNHSLVTSLKCKRDEKKLYTVVRHVKGASDCQESGESQQFADDIEYLLDGLKNSENTGTRCLSAMSFVEKCAIPSFRMHMRAHGTIAKVFGALQDAAQDPSLGLCTAGLMYMLSRDRLNMDLDRESLWLLVRLLSKDTGHRAKHLEAAQLSEYHKAQEKLWAVFSDLPKASNTLGDIECSDLSNGYLAMESLLSLTSRRAGEWFKEELRLAGGLEHIAQTVISAALSLSPVTGRMEGENLVLFKTMNRCLRVLENVTFMNNENQQFLLELKGCSLVKAVAKVLRMCESQLEMCGEPEVPVVKKLDSNSLHAILHQGLLATLRLLLNISHDNEWGSMKVGEQDGLMATTLQCVLRMPQFICKDQRFDVLVLSLGLLINLVEHSPANTRKLISMRTRPSYDSQSQDSTESSSESSSESITSLESLVQLFLQRQQAALKVESQSEEEMMEEEPEEWSEAHSDPLDWITIERDTGKGSQNGPQPTEEEIKSSVRKALHSAGKHMEDSIVASYTALLLGCLLRENNLNVVTVRDCLPDGDFTCMVDMLKKFLSFIELTNAAGNSGSKSISKVIEVLECF